MNIRPISFNAREKNYYKSTYNKTPILQEAPSISKEKIIQNALLGLALLGASTLTSCSQEFDVLPSEGITEITDDSHKSTLGRLDGMLKDIGLLDENTNSIYDAKSISFYDEEENIHFIKPTKIKGDTIELKKMKLRPNLTGETSKSIITTENGMILETNINKNNVSHFMYKKNKDDSYTEYKKINNIYVENGKLSKSPYKEMTKTNIDGSQDVYYGISNEREIPDIVDVSFDITIDSGYEK